MQLARLTQAIQEEDWQKALDVLDCMQAELERLQAVERFQLEAMRRPRAIPIKWPHG